MRVDLQAVIEEATVRQAHLLCDVNRHAEAAALAARLLGTDPGNVAGWLVLGRARLLAGDPAAALDAALAAGQLAPDLPECHVLAGAALAGLLRYAEAAQAVREAIALDPHRYHSYVLLAGVLSDSGENPAEALAAAGAAVRLEPDQPWAYVTQGAALAVTGRRCQAREAFRTALRLAPDYAPAHQGLARLAAQDRNPLAVGPLAEAASGLATAIKIDPGDQAHRNDLDRVLRIFLIRACYLLMMLSPLSAQLADNHPRVARLLALVAVAGPAAYAGNFLHRLGPTLCAYLHHVLPTVRMRLVLTCSGTAAALLLIATALPATPMRVCTVPAFFMALAARVIVHFEARDHLYGPGERTPYHLSTTTLVVIASFSGPVVLLMLAMTISTGDTFAVAVSTALSALPALCTWVIVQRIRRRSLSRASHSMTTQKDSTAAELPRRQGQSPPAGS